MDLIRELKDVRFELNLRGYDCDAVDAFLAKVRSELAELESDREAEQSRIANLEEQVSSGESDTEGTLRRTLILAQRLADETVADARQVATEMTASAEADAVATREAAQSEADERLASANHDAEQIARDAQSGLDEANSTAERITAEAAAAAEQTRSVAAEESERLLESAEASGAERVATLESVARVEVAAMREPIRDEVRQLEEIRSRLRADITALDDHLQEQRTRVREAVASLRQGMSGSIEDLERVAADEQLMSTVASPATSDVGEIDVPMAPDLDIAAAVADVAGMAPSVDELATEAAADVDAAQPEVVSSIADDFSEADTSEAEGLTVGEAAPDIDSDGPADDQGESSDAATELIPVVDSTASDVVDLDSEPSVLFETDVSSGADHAIEVDSAPVVDEDTDAEIEDALDDVDDAEVSPVADDLVGAAEVDGATVVVPEDETPEDTSGAVGFVQRFTDALGDLPITSPR